MTTPSSSSTGRVIPNPYTNVTVASHARAMGNVVPAIPGITATINATQTTATLSSASTFQNGDGVTIWGAGAPCSLSAPTGVTVTPSLAAAPTGLDIDVAGDIGSTTYTYEVVAIDQYGCYTAASTAVSTAKGAASLGAQSMAISGFTQSGNIVKAKVSSTAPLASAAYGFVYATTGTDGTYFGGWYNFTVASGTTLTYQTSNNVSTGAPTTSVGGGTLYYWNDNHITWTSASAPWAYIVYGRVSGRLVPVCMSTVNNVSGGYGATSCDDFGSKMMAGQLFPYWLPSTPPSSPLPDPLTTTIVAGGGTTKLILANAATTSVAGRTVLFDEAPNILTAATAAEGGLLYFPAGNYPINSYLVLPTGNAVELACSTLTLNMTLAINAERFYGMIGPQCTDLTQFGWPTGGIIATSHANPGVYDFGGGFGYIEGIRFTNAGNAQTSLFVDSPSSGQSRYENINFNGSSPNGYMDIPLYMRGGFWDDFDHIAFNVGPGGVGGGYIGATSTPAAYFQWGGLNFSYLSVQNRGLFHFPSAAGAEVQIYGESRDQGGITPFFTIYNNSGCVGGNITFTNVDMDTTPMAIFDNAANCWVGSVTIQPPYSGVTNGYGLVTGAPSTYAYRSPPSVQLCGTATACAQTVHTLTLPFLVYGGPILLSTGAITITSLPFASSTSYACSASDSTGKNPVQVVYNSGSSVTFKGTGSDSIRYQCLGY